MSEGRYLYDIVFRYPSRKLRWDKLQLESFSKQRFFYSIYHVTLIGCNALSIALIVGSHTHQYAALVPLLSFIGYVQNLACTGLEKSYQVPLISEENKVAFSQRQEHLSRV